MDEETAHRLYTQLKTVHETAKFKQGLGFANASGGSSASWHQQDKSSLASSFKSTFVAAGAAPQAPSCAAGASKRKASPDRHDDRAYNRDREREHKHRYDRDREHWPDRHSDYGSSKDRERDRGSEPDGKRAGGGVGPDGHGDWRSARGGGSASGPSPHKREERYAYSGSGRSGERYGDRDGERDRDGAKDRERERGRNDYPSWDSACSRGSSRAAAVAASFDLSRGHARYDRDMDRDRDRGLGGERSNKDSGKAKANEAEKDYAQLIPGYNSMNPIERLKARTRLALQQAEARKASEAGRDAESAGDDASRPWTRFVFNPYAALDGEETGSHTHGYKNAGGLNSKPYGAGGDEELVQRKYSAHGLEDGEEELRNALTFRRSAASERQTAADQSHQHAIFAPPAKVQEVVLCWDEGGTERPSQEYAGIAHNAHGQHAGSARLPSGSDPMGVSSAHYVAVGHATLSEGALAIQALGWKERAALARRR